VNLYFILKIKRVKCLVIRPNESNKTLKNDAAMVASITSFTSTTSAITNESENTSKSLRKQAQTLGIDEKTLQHEIIDCNHISENPANLSSNYGNINPILMTKIQNIDSNVSCL